MSRGYVTADLQQLETHHRFFSECPVETPASFSELCQRIYFPADDFSIAQWVIVNCGLFYLFRDSDKKQREAMQLSEEDIDQHSRLCDTNVSAAVQRMRLLLEPSIENMEALVLAANVCMETAKASAGWKLTSAAARLCLDCGLHQFQSQDPSAEPRKKRMLFWFIFCMDRGMALSFGRVPSIPEYDIAASKPLPTDLEGIWGEFFGIWIEFSTLQGDIYSQLFSASSKFESQEVRTGRARTLADRLKEHARFVERVSARYPVVPSKANHHRLCTFSFAFPGPLPDCSVLCRCPTFYKSLHKDFS